jgi:hypothetical protein
VYLKESFSMDNLMLLFELSSSWSLQVDDAKTGENNYSRQSQAKAQEVNEVDKDRKFNWEVKVEDVGCKLYPVEDKEEGEKLSKMMRETEVKRDGDGDGFKRGRNDDQGRASLKVVAELLCFVGDNSCYVRS